MSERPLFVVTHPRACSTAFERVFLTRSEDIACQHEPFGDAFYYGPERLGHRYASDESSCSDSGFAKTTYKDVLDRFADAKGKRVFIKDMAYYLMPPHDEPASLAPSLASLSDGRQETGDSETLRNPTVLPAAVLRGFQYAFLIRHPRYSIPSYYRCTIPPLVKDTQFHDFLSCEAGYKELRRFFDYVRAQGLVAATTDSQPTTATMSPLVVLDADDLLDRPVEGIRAFCEHVGIEYRPEMMQWDDEDNQKRAADAFEKWTGFHNDALASTGLKARTHKKIPLTDEEEDAQWKEKYGEEGQKQIRKCVNANVATYEYLKSFSLQF